MSEARRLALQQADALGSDLLLQSSEDLLPQHELRLIALSASSAGSLAASVAIPDAEISVQLDLATFTIAVWIHRASHGAVNSRC